MKIGSATSGGDAATKSDLARTSYNVDGTGIKIGVISDSYNFLNGASGGVASGDLPGVGNPNGYTTPITILDDDISTGTDEGRAMMEIIHDLAPGAELYFHSAFNNEQVGMAAESSIATAIDNLVAQGVDIIVDDVAYRNQPFYQDGLAAQSANAARDAGVIYYSAAGNSGNEGYEATFNDSGGGVHSFSTSSTDQLLDIVVQDGSTVIVTVQWDDPFVSIGTPTGFTPSDFDIGLYDIALGAFATTSTNDQTSGEDAWEFLVHTNTSGSAAQFGLFVQHFAGASNHSLKLIVEGGTIVDDDDTNSPTVFGHAVADGSLAVAAHRYDQLTSVESYSSLGGATILFDENGDPIVDSRVGAEYTAPDGVDTTFFGALGAADIESNGLPNFYGTSAAAPHAAAVAALVMQEAYKNDDGLQTLTTPINFELDTEDIRDILRETAVDIEAAGFDNVTGYGRIDAEAAVGGVLIDRDWVASGYPANWSDPNSWDQTDDPTPTAPRSRWNAKIENTGATDRASVVDDNFKVASLEISGTTNSMTVEFDAGVDELAVFNDTTVGVNGVLDLGADAAGTDLFTTHYTQDADGTLVLTLDDGADADTITVTGNASLDGTLDLELAAGMTPSFDDSWIIVDNDGTGSISGFFAFVNWPTLGAINGNNVGLAVTYDGDVAAYTDGNVHADVALLGDLNLDGTVGPADLAELKLNWLGTGKRWFEGDLTGDGQVGPADLAALKLNWLASESGGAAPLPEPASLALLGLGAVALGRRRRQ